MMNYVFLLAVLALVPVAAIIDYYIFGNRVRQFSGKEPGRWFWLTPCALECGCFMMGYILRGLE